MGNTIEIRVSAEAHRTLEDATRALSAATAAFEGARDELKRCADQIEAALLAFPGPLESVPAVSELS